MKTLNRRLAHLLHRRAAGLLAAAVGLASVALVATNASAADPTPRVKSRAAPRPPENDRGGAGPNAGSKAGERPEGQELKAFPQGSPAWVVRQAFRCALEHNESSGFDCYAALNVETNRDNENARVHLRRYQWSHFRKWAASYPLPGKEFVLLQTRQVPAKLEPQTSEVKLFLWSRHRDNPAPITLRREGGRWLIYSNSL
ncbi:MAG: hypothetical protein RIT45_3427 [Pseudomonadota bacterium]|jgi:hypothetical protein